jgi:hypothetical protein
MQCVFVSAPNIGFGSSSEQASTLILSAGTARPAWPTALRGALVTENTDSTGRSVSQVNDEAEYSLSL